MKIMPTEEGGLRLETEDDGDWQILRGIPHDAVSCDVGLAQRLGRLITQEEVAADWREFIGPDLESEFSSAVVYVATAITAAHVEAAGGPGPLWITRDDAFQWYSALNQARLALEDRFHFGPEIDVDPAGLPPIRRAAFLRSRFYCLVQSLLLDHVLR